jgi:hypothetical protein
VIEVQRVIIADHEEQGERIAETEERTRLVIVAEVSVRREYSGSLRVNY